MEAAVEERMEKAYQFALDAPLPDPADVLKYNYACDKKGVLPDEPQDHDDRRHPRGD